MNPDGSDSGFDGFASLLIVVVPQHKKPRQGMGRLIAGQMDRRLIERTIEIATQSQAFGPRSLTCSPG